MIARGLELEARTGSIGITENTRRKSGAQKGSRKWQLLSLRFNIWWNRKDVEYVLRKLRGIGLQDPEAARICLETTTSFMGRGSGYLQQLSSLQGHLDIFNALQIFRGRKSVVEYCFLTLSDVVETSEKARNDLISKNALSVVLSIMEQHSHESSVQEYGMLLLFRLARGIPAPIRARFVKEGAIDYIIICSQLYFKNEELVIVALGCLNVLLTKNDKVSLSERTLENMIQFLLEVTKEWKGSEKVIRCINGAAFPIVAPATERGLTSLKELLEELPSLSNSKEAPRFSLD